MEGRDQIGLPARAALGLTGMHVALAEIAPGELHDPFMQETVNRVPARQTAVHVPTAALGEAPANSAPAGVIFHVARCGSTLVSQLLKLHEGLIVYSEPLPFNEILVPPRKGDRAALVAALRSLGGFFARHAGKPYVLKLTSWNTLFCDVVADAFPQTPWALCVRDPLEVCVSLVEQRPGWLKDAAAPVFAKVVDPAQSARNAEEYVARVYAAFCEAVGKLDAKRGALVAYEALPDATWNVLAPHFGLSIGDDVKDRMAAASQTYSKSPVGKAAKFVPDDERKRAAASAELRLAVDAIARPALQTLAAKFRNP